MKVIDPNRLPQRAAVDAGVLMRALEPHHQDPYAQACRDFWDAMLADRNREIMIPAPSLAEYLRNGATPPPSAAQVYVVPFDGKCATLLADRLPMKVLDVQIEAFKQEFGDKAPGSYIKYDAMIAACAKRWGAQFLVSIDKHHPKLGPELPINCCEPAYFYVDPPAQPMLNFPSVKRVLDDL